MAIATKATRGKGPVRKANKGGAQLCVTTLYDPPARTSFPVEIRFPTTSEEEEKKIKAAIERLVRRLGYSPSWIPLI
jgi:hypothetical protein